MEYITPQAAKQYSPATLAFYGDSVYEVLVRRYLVLQANCPASQLHDRKIQLVCAGFQAACYDGLLSRLDEDEAAILRRGRNAAVTVPRHTSALVYHKATGLEALFGYLALVGAKTRLNQLFQWMMEQESTIQANTNTKEK